MSFFTAKKPSTGLYILVWIFAVVPSNIVVNFLDTFLESGRSILIDRAATCYINGINYNYAENKNGQTFSLSCEMVDSGVKG